MLFLYLFSSPRLWLIASAVIPAAVLMGYINKKDRLEKEPPRMLLGLVLWGVASTFLALISESVLEAALSAFCEEDSTAYRVIMYFIIVGGSEEGFKYLLLRKKTWSSPEFNCSFDAVVYAVFVSLGFALWENIGYVFSYGISVAFSRALTAVPGHASFGVFMGACYGMAKKCHNYGLSKGEKRWSRCSLLLPAIIHGLYDFLATADGKFSGLGFFAFIAVVFVASFVTVKNLSDNDKFISRQGFYF